MTSNILESLISSSYTLRAIYRPVFPACSHLQLISYDFDLSWPLASHPGEQGSLWCQAETHNSFIKQNVNMNMWQFRWLKEVMSFNVLQKGWRSRLNGGSQTLSPWR